MSQPKFQATVALLFAAGDRLFDCRIAQADAIPQVGAAVELNERDLHTRSHEHCTRPCCAQERTAKFIVRSASEKGSGWDGLNAAIDDRDWEEGRCTQNEWCRLFDSYSLAGYLRLDASNQDETMPERVILIEVEMTSVKAA